MYSENTELMVRQPGMTCPPMSYEATAATIARQMLITAIA